MNKNINIKNTFLALVVITLIALIAYSIFTPGDNAKKPEPPPKYSDIVGYFQNDEIAKYEFKLGNGELKYLKRGLEDTKENWKKFTVPNVNLFIEDINQTVIDFNKDNPENAVIYDMEKDPGPSILVSLLPYLLLIAIVGAGVFFLMRSMNSMNKIGQVSRTTNNAVLQAGRRATFADVAGADEEKEELAEVVAFLKYPEKFADIGARIPKGVLLAGPPGTGKTLLARAVAGEAGVPFFSISGSDFVEMYVGAGASRVRDLFAQAKRVAPAIIFIDEIDAVGRQRGAGLGGSHDEREQTLNQILVEMDGFDGNDGVIIIAATNRADILDPALLRPGRFDRQVYVMLPDVGGREAILNVYCKNKPLAADVDLKTVARTTIGFSGADLENLLNEAAILAARKNNPEITALDIQDAVIKIVAGVSKKSRVVTEEDKKLTAYHEAGHAVSAYYLENTDAVHQISIIPRGGAGGYTMYLPENDNSYVLRGKMNDNLVSSLGGRVAESIIFDDISTGASSDLQHVTAIARAMVTKYGFSEKLGNVVYGQGEHQIFLGRDFTDDKGYSDVTAHEIDEEIRALINAAYDRCSEILTTHRDKLEKIAQELLVKETIEKEEFIELMKD
jgi:ATP-dependent metalloprotease FtsH